MNVGKKLVYESAGILFNKYRGGGIYVGQARVKKSKGNRLISVAKTQSSHGEEKEPCSGKLKSMGLIIGIDSF